MAQIPPWKRGLSVWSVSNRALPGIGISFIGVYLVQGRRLPVYALREVAAIYEAEKVKGFSMTTITSSHGKLPMLLL